MTSFAARSAGAVLAGATNFRDLGGYSTADGRRVRHGRVFRSGHLGGLAPQDIALLQRELGPRVCVVDFRGSQEREKAACLLPGASVHSLPFEPAVAKRLEARAAAGLPLTADATRQFMHDAYRSFVREHRHNWSAFFAHVLERDDDEPLVLHCAAGKDRTGLASALLLSALGVPRDTVMDDYLHTAQRFHYQPREGRFPLQVMQVIAATEPGFLDAALGAIDEDFGGIAGFLRQGLGLDDAQCERLRMALLEPLSR